MGRPTTTTLTDGQCLALATATALVAERQAALDAAVSRRHALWRSLVADGASQSEVARASGVLRQAVGWAMTHQ